MENIEETEEIDYMSDSFLEQCTGGGNDIRPGLTSSHSMKRKYGIERKKLERDVEYRKKWKPSELKNMQLQKGLATAIDCTNKGFAMLEKMGYKPGMSLGKEGKGRLEPVGIELKCDKKGLGWQQIIVERRKLLKIRREHKTEETPEEYRTRLSNKHQQKLIDGDLQKSRKACYNLDQSSERNDPYESWFWPEYTIKQDDTQDDERSGSEDDFVETLDSSDQLEVLTSYLRETYLYCIWCGQTYDSLQELNLDCPGNTRTYHD